MTQTQTSQLPAHIERRLHVGNDVAIAYDDYAPQGAQQGVPVLCLHGLTRNARDFSALAPLITATGRRVIAVDQRGRGRSSHDADPSHYAVDVYVSDMAALLDELQVEKAVFVGTSMGGIITMRMAMQAPGRVAAAVLNDVGPDLSTEGLDRIASYVGDAALVTNWDEAIAYAKKTNLPAFPDEDEPGFWRAFAERLFREDANGRLALDYDPAIAKPLRDPAIIPLDLWAAFDALSHVPTMLVRGAISDLLARETVAQMKARRPDLQVVEAARVGHAPFLTEPDVWPHLAEFLRMVP